MPATPEDRSALIVRRLLAVQPGEQVAIVLDRSSEWRMADALAAAVVDAGAEYTLLTIPDRATERKNDLTPIVEAGLERADVLIGLTRSSGAPTYARAVKRLYDAGALRGLSMVMRDMANFTDGAALADYDALLVEGRSLAGLWRRATRIRVETPAGTDLEAEIEGDGVIVECGFATEPGQEAAFSDGEVSQMPSEGTAHGRLVIDGPVAHLDGTDPYRLTVENGRVTAIEGDGERAAALRTILETVPHADNIAEIAVGLNPAARRNGDFEEEKKARGLVHVAIGDNVFYGGTVECAVHMDQVLYEPSVWLDDRQIVKGGRVLKFD